MGMRSVLAKVTGVSNIAGDEDRCVKYKLRDFTFVEKYIERVDDSKLLYDTPGVEMQLPDGDWRRGTLTKKGNMRTFTEDLR